MLDKNDLRKLRGMGNSLGSMVQIGKSGLSENLMKLLDNELEAHELVKITILKTADIDPDQAAEEIASRTGSQIVQVIGRTLLLYRKSKENRLEIRS